MKRDLIPGIVKILRPDKSTAGTGFVVADDLVVTCAHVASTATTHKDGRTCEDVKLVFQTGSLAALAEVVAEWWNPEYAGDVAFLRLKEPLPEGILPLKFGSSQGTEGHNFQSFGFPSASPDEGIWADGHILGETLVQGMRMLQLSSPQITQGFSGAPVFDVDRKRVVGMVTAIAPMDRHGRMAETTFITPTETLLMICPQLELSDLQPYLGLAAFGEADADIFFGRRREVGGLLARLRQEPRFLAVLGPSGSGKSSVIHAGLIPQIRCAGLPGSDRWGIIAVRPGEKPRESLRSRGFGESVGQDLAEAARVWLDKNPDRTRLLIVLDQFEEILVITSQERRQDFLEQLMRLLEADLPITLILIMRDDFFSRFAKEAPSALFEWVQRGFVHISANLEEGELKEIIKGPAKKVGLEFEDGLVEVMVKDVLEGADRGKPAGRSTILPLLEFALTELWRRRKDGYLTHEAYSAIGGVTGSLTQWADEAYQDLARDGLEKAARSVLTELVSLGDERVGIPDSKRRRSFKDFKIGADPAEEIALRKTIMRLADARLVTTSLDLQSNQEIVEIIHDSLIQEWERLRKWIKDDRNFLTWEREIDRDARDWIKTSPINISARDDGRLLRGLKLSEAEIWLKEREEDIGQHEREFIQISRDLQMRERTAQEHQRRRIIFGLAIGLGIALVLGSISTYEWRNANEQWNNAKELLSVAQSDRGIQFLQSNDLEGLLYLLQAIKTVNQQPRSAESRYIMWLTWYESFVEKLERIIVDSERESELIAFSPDGKFLAVSSNRSLQLLETDNWKLKNLSLNYSGRIDSIAFSPDGKFLAVSSNRSLQLLETYNWQQKEVLSNYIDVIRSVAFSPNGKLLAAGSDSGSVLLLNITVDKPQIRQFKHNRMSIGNVNTSSWVRSIAFSPNGKYLVSGGSDNTLRIWETSTSKEVSSINFANTVNSVAFSPDNSSLAIGLDDGTVRFCNPETFKPFSLSFGLGNVPFLVNEEYINHLSFSPDGILLAVGSGNNINIWNMTSYQYWSIRSINSIGDIKFSPNGKFIAATSNGMMYLWNTFSEQLKSKRLICPGSIWTVTFSPNGKLLATGSNQGILQLWNPFTGLPMGQPLNKENENTSAKRLVKSIAFSPDSSLLAEVSFNNFRDPGKVSLWNLETKPPSSKEFAHKFKLPPVAVAISPDGRLLAVGSWDGNVQLWDIQTGQLYGRPLFCDQPVMAIAFSPDSKFLATGTGVGVVEIWNLITKQPQGKPIQHKGVVTSIAFDRDGKTLATASWDKLVGLWDVDTHNLKIPFLIHNSKVDALAISMDGKILATGSEDIIQLWDLTTGQPCGLPIKIKGDIISLAFSPDGNHLAAGLESNNGNESAQVWTLPSREYKGFRETELRTWLMLGAQLNDQGVVESITGHNLKNYYKELMRLNQSYPLVYFN